MKNSEFVTYNLPDRRIERALRKKVQKLSAECDRLKKQLEIANQQVRILKSDKTRLMNKNRRFSRELRYCDSIVNDLKNKRDQIKMFEEKRTFNRLINCEENRRVFSKKYSVKTLHYQKKSKNIAAAESEYRIQRKELRLSVKSFYLSDENSYPAPGAKHFVVKKKVRKRKRYFSDTIQNLYKKYCDTVSEISQALFFRLKPWWIAKLKVSARETCLCVTHENMKLKFQRICVHKITRAKSLIEYLKDICCNIDNEECMHRTCEACKDRKLSTSQSRTETTHYYCWKTEKITRKGAKDRDYEVKVMSKHKILCTLTELIEEFNKELEKYSRHVFSTTVQHKSLDALKKKIEKNEGYVIVDFSQSYNCKSAKEIQGTHFGASRKQISLHTGGFYYKSEEDKLQFESFAVISDDLTHDAVAIWALLEPILKRIGELLPNVDTLHFQSDGPATQYKNKTNFYLFHYFMNELNLQRGTWNYTTAGHGKSVADGIGGTVKGMCDRYVANGSDITCAKDMHDYINKSSSSIKCYTVTAEQISEMRKIVPEDLKVVKDTTKVHQVVWGRLNANELFFRYLTCPDCALTNSCEHYSLSKSKVTWSFAENVVDDSFSNAIEEAAITFEENEWISVIYDKLWYPGLIKSIKNDQITVTFLKRGNKSYEWPVPEDIQVVVPAQILCKIDEPRKITKNKKQRYLISDYQIKSLDELTMNCKIYDI